MHAYDHGVAMHIITAVMRTLHKLEKDLGLTKNSLVKKLTARVYKMCSSIETKHETMLRFTHQSIVTLFENLSTPNKKGKKQSPIVDATDVQKLMLALPYLLDGLALEELNEFNLRAGASAKVSDPMPATIMAVNGWLTWYHLYRKEEPDESDVERLTAMGKELLKTLERTFPFRVKIGNGLATRSMWCNEKVHSILHAPRNLMRMGRSKNISCQVTETRHKSIKLKGTKTNRKPGTMGLSIMKQEVRESAMEGLAMKMDRHGPRWVRRLPSGPGCHRSAQEGHGGVAIDSDGPESSGSSGSESSGSESESDPSPAPVLPAMRYFERDEDEKTKGCMGDGLRCNVWARANAVHHMQYELVKGWTAVKGLGVRKGNLGFRMQDINWTETSAGVKPKVLDQLPCLAYLSNKVVHYLVDYHSDCLHELCLPQTNGEHNQLAPSHFHSVLERLQDMPDVKKKFQVYSAIHINHSRGGFQGVQTVHASPFTSCGSTPREVTLYVELAVDYVLTFVEHISFSTFLFFFQIISTNINLLTFDQNY